MGVIICAYMLANAWWPIIEVSYMWGLRVLFRMLDQGRIILNYDESTTTTKQKTIAGYVDLYQGPIFEIHWKYANILDVVYVAFMFGPMMPILFPIALLNLIIMYICEKLLVAYIYQRPPMYDQTLNEVTIRSLYGAPILYCVFACWVFSNQQLF